MPALNRSVRLGSLNPSVLYPQLPGSTTFNRGLQWLHRLVGDVPQKHLVSPNYFDLAATHVYLVFFPYMSLPSRRPQRPQLPNSPSAAKRRHSPKRGRMSLKSKRGHQLLVSGKLFESASCSATPTRWKFPGCRSSLSTRWPKKEYKAGSSPSQAQLSIDYEL